MLWLFLTLGFVVSVAMFVLMVTQNHLSMKVVGGAAYANGREHNATKCHASPRQLASLSPARTTREVSVGMHNSSDEDLLGWKH